MLLSFPLTNLMMVQDSWKWMIERIAFSRASWAPILLRQSSNDLLCCWMLVIMKKTHQFTIWKVYTTCLHFAYKDRRNVEIRFRYDHEIHLGPEEAVDRSQCLHRTSMLWMWWMVVKFHVGMVKVPFHKKCPNYFNLVLENMFPIAL